MAAPQPVHRTAARPIAGAIPTRQSVRHFALSCVGSSGLEPDVGGGAGFLPGGIRFTTRKAPFRPGNRNVRTTFLSWWVMPMTKLLALSVLCCLLRTVAPLRAAASLEGTIRLLPWQKK